MSNLFSGEKVWLRNTLPTYLRFRYMSKLLQFFLFFKLRLGALIPRSVCLSVCRSVCLSVGRSVGRSSKNYKKKLQNFTKLYKTLQSVTKHLGRPSRKLWQYAGAKGRQIAFRRRLSTRFALNALVINEPYISHKIAEHWKSLQK